jgi:hypothetical protein
MWNLKIVWWGVWRLLSSEIWFLVVLQEPAASFFRTEGIKTLLLWRCRQQIPPECWYLSVKPYSYVVTSWKIANESFVHIIIYRPQKTCCLQLHQQVASRAVLAACLCWFPAWHTLWSWRWRRYVPPKCQLIFNSLHSIISQKLELFITTTERTLNPKKKMFAIELTTWLWSLCCVVLCCVTHISMVE